jgi:dihydrofolate synthase/folylpolyglutamate synthase
LGDALAWLDGHQNLERMTASVAAGRPVPPDLSRMSSLMELLDHPERSAPVIHITGTNGKTSTARAVTSLLGARGLRAGTFTSPHLSSINERIAVSGPSDTGPVVATPISDADLAAVLSSLAGYESMLNARLTWFELMTAAAFLWFADQPVDVMVLEVGMGGRWDATNVATASVAVVTNVGTDHIEFLGPSKVDIAREKAGIAKPSSTLVVGSPSAELMPVFEAAGAAALWLEGRDFFVERNDLAVGGRALSLRTPAASYEDVWLDLHGSHQGHNFACAVAAVEAFFDAPTKDELVREAAASVSSPGRMELVSRSPLILLDGAKNIEGAMASAATIAEEFGPDRQVILVVGMLGGVAKEPAAMLSALGVGGPSVRLVVACPAPSPRSVDAALVADAARRLGCGAIEAPGVEEALDAARADAGDHDVIVVTGSLYVVGAARRILG